jgi:hypothetical protein
MRSSRPGCRCQGEWLIMTPIVWLPLIMQTTLGQPA